ncbi:MAG: ABC-F family ATP-binding cassette domain-containing protein [Anaerolineae bacterium]|jgi:ATP-binding cassette subfamily F protein 3
MSLVSATNLRKHYGPQDVFEGLSLDIPHEGRIALVGPNGSGKTTLLRLIAGLETPSGGRIHRARRLRIAYLPQKAQLEGDMSLWQAMEAVFADLKDKLRRLRQLEAIMADSDQAHEAMERYGVLLEAFEREGGYTFEARIGMVLSGLGFSPDEFDQPLDHLSGGQRTRALLARVLLEDPDLMLLDEPTNHLDLAGVEWLEGYLSTWQGAMVVVAHDRAFLDHLAEQVWELSFGDLAVYRGNYSSYVLQREERLTRQWELYERQQQKIAKTEAYIRRYMAGQRSAQAQGRQKRLERMERIERPQQLGTMHLDLGSPLRSGDLVLGLHDLVVGYDAAEPLLSADEVVLRRGQQVALLGPNGTGKTTLLRTILGELPPLSGRIRIGAGVHMGYFAQAHAGLDPEKTVLDTILDAGLPSLSRARDLLGQYRFSGDDVFKRVGDLSGGEQARVALAVLALQGANFLLLDEPTNHLDIPSQEVLQGVLGAFEGTVLMVSHDRYLIQALSTQVWAIAEEQLWTFAGYDQYQAWRQERRGEMTTAQGDGEDEEQKRDARRGAHRAAKREAERRARERVEVEQAILRLEDQIERLETELAAASAAQEVDRVTELGTEYRQLQEELEARIERWEALV